MYLVIHMEEKILQIVVDTDEVVSRTSEYLSRKSICRYITQFTLYHAVFLLLEEYAGHLFLQLDIIFKVRLLK